MLLREHNANLSLPLKDRTAFKVEEEDESGRADTGVKRRVDASSCENKELKGDEEGTNEGRRQSSHVTGMDESSAAEKEDNACAEVTRELSE